MVVANQKALATLTCQISLLNSNQKYWKSIHSPQNIPVVSFVTTVPFSNATSLPETVKTTLHVPYLFIISSFLIQLSSFLKFALKTKKIWNSKYINSSIQPSNHIRDMFKANNYPSAVISNILKKKPPSLTVPPPKAPHGFYVFQMGRTIRRVLGFHMPPLHQQSDWTSYEVTPWQWNSNWMLSSELQFSWFLQHKRWHMDETHMNLWKLNINMALSKDNKHRAIANLISIDIC